MSDRDDFVNQYGSFAVPLLRFLEIPRDWWHLLQWGKENKVSHTVMCNLLAWLEQTGRARYDKSNQVWGVSLVILSKSYLLEDEHGD